jgi:hypothetical protein
MRSGSATGLLAAPPRAWHGRSLMTSSTILSLACGVGLFVALAPACSGGAVASSSNDGGEPPDAGDASRPRDASEPRDAEVDAPVDALASCDLYPLSGTACNSLPLFDAQVVEPTCATGTEPAPTGGTIANGVYILQSSAYYGGCPGTMTSRITWSICQSQWESAQETNGVDVPSNALASSQAASNSVSLTIVCPMPGAATYGYDATSSTLSLHVPVDSYVRVDTFAMQ